VHYPALDDYYIALTH